MDREDSVDDVSAGVAAVDLDGVDGGSSEYTDTDMHTEPDISELPSVLIITNVADDVFNTNEGKDQFETAFRKFDPTAEFQYLKSFRRARVVFESTLMATKARIHLHEAEVSGQIIKCFFSQPVVSTEGTSSHLEPPARTKQFLISPPASPPVGWEPITEHQPVINYDLLSALAGLAPGEAHELHPRSNEHPAIVVHICEDPAGFDQRPDKIVQTRRPDS